MRASVASFDHLTRGGRAGAEAGAEVEAEAEFDDEDIVKIKNSFVKKKKQKTKTSLYI